ncbi:hypothetical protein [Phascolarctobacterium faecium]|jgi:hypothetical protein|uniref:hypothetical protein n=1 Tax=Phascolarctobacterium faecium TaxID=33025 RepID=UPI003AAFCA20
MVTILLSAIDRSVARSCEWQIRERWKLPPGETMQVSRGTAIGRKAPGRAQQQLLMDGTAVESAFALLLAKVTKPAAAAVKENPIKVSLNGR